MNIDERLIELIKLRLRGALKKAKILPHAESLFILNTDDSEWYFIMDSNGQLRFNSKFFDTTFLLFSMSQNEYSPILKDIVEKAFNFPIRSVQRVRSDLNWEVRIVLSDKRKDWDMKTRYGFPFNVVKNYVENKDKWFFIELF